MIGLRIKHGRKALMRLHTAVLRGDLKKLGTLVRLQFSVEAVVATYGLVPRRSFFYQGLARIPVLLRLANRRGRFIKADGRFIKAASLSCSFFPTVATLSAPRARPVAGDSNFYHFP